ncbi:FtsX-like permease family protein [Dehalococcoidia bacterium]|nr:FtsX-like permease family protein [Dehalococcoidia bacterium]
MTALTASFVLLARRIRANWRFLLALFAGVLLATTLLSSAPLYFGAIKELGLRHALEFERTGVLHTAINVPLRPLEESGYARTRDRIHRRMGETIQPLVEQEVAHIATPPMNLSMPDRLKVPQGAVMGSLQSFSNYELHSRLVEGVFPDVDGHASAPTSIIQVGIGSDTARALRLRLHDQVVLSPGSTPNQGLTLRIVGILEAVDLREEYWTFALNPFASQLDSSSGEEIPIAPFLIPQETFFAEVEPVARGLLVNYWWYLYVDPARVESDRVGAIQESITSLGRNLGKEIPGSLVLTGLKDTLATFEQKLFFSSIPILMMLVLSVVVVLYYLVMVANVVVDRHLGEIALFRSRGANKLQIFGIFVWEALAICLLAVIVGPVLALAIVPLLGWAPAFSVVTGGRSLPVELSGTVFLFALGGATLSFLVLMISAFKGARFNVLTEKALKARPDAGLIFHKYYLDIFLLAMAGLLYWELTQRGSLVTRRIFGADSTDYVLLVAPAVFMGGLALVLLRVLPVLIRLVGVLVSQTTRVWLVLALWNIGRNPSYYLRPIVLLTLITGLGVVASSFVATVESSFRDRGLYESGADARLIQLPRTVSGTKEWLVGSLDQQPGVRQAAPAFRSAPSVMAAGAQRNYHLLAVDSIRFNKVGWFRDDFSGRSFFALLRHLDRGRSLLRGRDLPEGTQTLGLWVKPAQEFLGTSLWLRIRDDTGAVFRYKLGRLDFESWRFLQADLVNLLGELPQEPLVLESIYLWEFDSPDRSVPQGTLIAGHVSSGQINVSDLTVTVAGEEAVLDPLVSGEGWRVMATTALLQEKIRQSTEITRVNENTTELSWQNIPGYGIRGMIPSELGEPLPIIAGGRFLAATGRRIGDVIEISVAGINVPVVIVDEVRFFPTMNPDTAFVLGNLDVLLHYSNLFRVDPILPNEVWISLHDDESQREAFISSMQRSSFAPYLAMARHEVLDRLKTDPLVGAGSSGIVFSIYVVLFVVILVGYLGYFYVSSYRLNLEYAVLRALGFSTRQLVAVQMLTHALVMGGAAVMGAWIGGRAHSMIITFLQHNERGRQVVPPIEPQTDWTGLAVVLIAMGITLLVVLGFHGFTFARVPVWRMLRRGEE